MVTGTNQSQGASSPPPPPTAVEMTVSASTKRASENRRSNKPIMEKRRRARINSSLNELKTLILDAMKKDPARHSKLEKADILEMTVKHLQNLQRQQAVILSDPSSVTKFRAGFSECATEVGKYPGLEPVVKRRLLQHLANSLNQVSKSPSEPTHPDPAASVATAAYHHHHHQNIILSGGGVVGGAVQLVPTRLPNGDIALVLPGAHHQQAVAAPTAITEPVPLLVPIPQRTASTASSSSASGARYTPSNSPEPDVDVFGCGDDDGNGPLALVVRKDQAENQADEALWRPW